MRCALTHCIHTVASSGGCTTPTYIFEGTNDSVSLFSLFFETFYEVVPLRKYTSMRPYLPSIFGFILICIHFDVLKPSTNERLISKCMQCLELERKRLYIRFRRACVQLRTSDKKIIKQTNRPAIMKCTRPYV